MLASLSQPSYLQVPSVNSFTTNFPLTETPITGFLQGLTPGLDWFDVNSTTNNAHASTFATAADDSVACKTGFTGNKHSSQITVRKFPGYDVPNTLGGVSQEVECLTGWNISAHVITGYEFDIDFNGNAIFVRWNGAANDFTPNGDPGWTDIPTHAIVSGIVDGDQVRVDYNSTSGNVVLNAYVNGVLKNTVSDTSAGKIMSGNPGFGFFVRPGVGMDLTKYYISSFTAANL